MLALQEVRFHGHCYTRSRFNLHRSRWRIATLRCTPFKFWEPSQVLTEIEGRAGLTHELIQCAYG